MKMKKCSIAAVWLTAVLVMMVNSVTVFAYPKITTVEGEWESVEEAERFINAALEFITKNASVEELQKDIVYETEIYEVRYEKQFIDEYGNIYQVKDDMGASVYGSCSHEYVSGTFTEHNKNADGSCTVDYYDGKRCGKCGNMKINKRLYGVNYNPCPH